MCMLIGTWRKGKLWEEPCFSGSAFLYLSGIGPLSSLPDRWLCREGWLDRTVPLSGLPEAFRMLAQPSRNRGCSSVFSKKGMLGWPLWWWQHQNTTSNHAQVATAPGMLSLPCLVVSTVHVISCTILSTPLDASLLILQQWKWTAHLLIIFALDFQGLHPYT